MARRHRSDRVNASPKAKIAMMKIMRGVPEKQALADAGYSKTDIANGMAMAHRRNTKGWNELLDKHLPEAKLVEGHAEGLDATTITPDGEEKVDFSTRLKYIELGYKLRGKLHNDGQSGNTYNVHLYSPEQLKRIAARVVQPDSAASEGASPRLLDRGESPV